MLASELIECIGNYIKVHGDLPISITISAKLNGSEKPNTLFGADGRDICVGYNQYDEEDGGDVINIRNFLY